MNKQDFHMIQQDCKTKKQIIQRHKNFIKSNKLIEINFGQKSQA